MSRAAHGRAAQLGRLTASECKPWDEQPPATPSPTARVDRDAAGRFQPGNRAGQARRIRAGSRGALATLENKGDDAARAALSFGRRYAAHRRAELASSHGGELSAGVGAMVESAGELLASARYWSARSIAEANPDHARLAAQLIAGSRQAERDAWELASREATARPRARRAPVDVDALVAAANARALAAEPPDSPAHLVTDDDDEEAAP